MTNIVNTYVNEDYSYRSLSYDHFFSKGYYHCCNFSHCDINYAQFKDKVFKNCNFSHADIGGTEFKDCDFINCKFNYTNLVTSIFSGCHFVNEKNEGAGIIKCSTSNITFRCSQNRRGLIKNIKLEDLGFRESLFDGIDFYNICFSSISLEDSRFLNCHFDSLDLCSNNIKGLSIRECSARLFFTTFEKFISIIGVEFISSCEDFVIFTDSKKQHRIGNVYDKEFRLSITSTRLNLLKTGAIFEYVNLCALESFVSGKNISGDDILDFITGFIKGYTGNSISPKNYINLVDLISSYQACNVQVLKSLHELSSLIFTKNTSEKFKALLLYKLERLSYIPSISHGNLVITDHGSSFNLESRKELSEIVSLILELSNLESSNSVFQKKGSVIEQVLVNFSDLIENIWQLSYLLILLGFKFRKETKSGSIIEFGLSAFSGNKNESPSTASKLSDLDVSEKITPIIRNEIQKSLKASGIEKSSPSSNLSFSQEELKKIEDIKGLIQGKSIGLELRKALIKEFLNDESTKSLLLEDQLK